jgi:WhiB family transcriptional regulator, redox-sensing transcriptional regulator
VKKHARLMGVRVFQPEMQESAIPGWNLPDDDEPTWVDLALCAQTDPEIFFPEKGGSTREAKRVCRGCEVRAECLEYALENDERFGIWGGLSERERGQVKRLTSPPPVRDPTKCKSGRHPKTPEGTGARGACLACKRESANARAEAKRFARIGSKSPRDKRRLAA